MTPEQNRAVEAGNAIRELADRAIFGLDSVVLGLHLHGCQSGTEPVTTAVFAAKKVGGLVLTAIDRDTVLYRPHALVAAHARLAGLTAATEAMERAAKRQHEAPNLESLAATVAPAQALTRLFGEVLEVVAGFRMKEQN